MWTIYDHPLDYPRHFVVRQFLIVPKRPEPLVAYIGCLYDTLDEARYDCFLRGGTIQFERSPGDDPFIIETWMR